MPLLWFTVATLVFLALWHRRLVLCHGPRAPHPADSETELKRYHLDPPLYQGSEPAISALWGNFAD